MILDIDRFKQFNDAHGHVAGDECLKRIAALLAGIARRPRDVVARFGGEEFILLLPETDAVAARELADACASGIAGLRIAHGASDAGEHVSASAGVGTTVAGGEGDALGFLDAVDRTLYVAKGGGRNRIEVLPA